jgi:uncharacterized protein (DUF3084 family)
MTEDEILKEFLKKAVEDAKKEIAESGKLSVENAIPLLLDSQYNHILHLEREMCTKGDLEALRIATKNDLKALEERLEVRFAQIDQRFSQIDQRFSQIDQRFSQIDQRFSQIDQRFSDIKHWLMYGVAILALIITLTQLFLP